MNISSNITSLNSNQQFINTTANNIANVNTDGYIALDTKIGNNLSANTRQSDNTNNPRSQTDLTKEIPNLIVSQNVNSVNINAIKTQNEMLGSLLDIKT